MGSPLPFSDEVHIKGSLAEAGGYNDGEDEIIGAVDRGLGGICSDRFRRWSFPVPDTPVPEDTSINVGVGAIRVLIDLN